MEPPSPISTDLLIIGFAILAVAVLSTAEASFIAVNKIRIRSMMERGDVRARAVLDILGRHDKFFSAVILSGNLFTVLATSLGTVLAMRLFVDPETGIIVATIVLTILTVIFGELAPKTFAVSHAERVSLFLARPLMLYIKLITPLIWIFNVTVIGTLRALGLKIHSGELSVTEDEIKTMIELGGREGAIEQDESKLLNRVFEFGDTEVSEAMVPRTEMVTINSAASVTDALALVSAHGYSRYPVIGETIDDIKGVLYVKDILTTMNETDISHLSVDKLMRDAYIVPEVKMVTELLDEMQKNNFHIAVVVDEHGGTAGLVTLEDIMEEIVGGLQDEFEKLEAVKDVEIIDERTFIVSGQAPIDEVNEMLGANIPSEDFNTIAGFVFGRIGHLPKVDDAIHLKAQNLKFLVMEMDGKKIAKLKISKM